MIEYVYLTFAIILELFGTTLLKYTKGFTVIIPTLTCLLCYGFCYFFFSKFSLAKAFTTLIAPTFS